MLRIFVILFLISFSANAADPRCKEDYTLIEERYEKGLLFEVINCTKNYPPSYVFGTMHSDAAELIPLLGPAFEALKKSASANFEIDDSPAQTMQAMQKMYYAPTSDKNLKAVIGDKMYMDLQTLISAYDKKLPEAAYLRIKPWAIAVLLQYPTMSNDGIHVDKRFELLAEKNNIPVYGLENAADALLFFEDMSEAEGIEFLRDIIDNFAVTERLNERLTKAYLNEDLEEIKELTVEGFEIMDDELMEEKFLQMLIKDRNDKMFDAVIGRVPDGAFIAVGALHLPWDYGLLRKFENLGYRIYQK